MGEITRPTAVDISLADILLSLKREWRFVILLSMLGMALVGGIYFALPRYYESSALILPPQQQQNSAMGALSQLGALAGIAGGASSMKGQEEMYAALLRTKRLQSSVIAALDLRKKFPADSKDDLLKMISSSVYAVVDKKSGMITVTAVSKDPKFASDMANAHVAELKALLNTLALTDAQQRRAYWAQQIDLAQKKYGDMERDFLVAQKKEGVFLSDSIMGFKVKAAADIKTKILEKEVQLLSMSRNRTNENPEVLATQAQLGALRKQLSQLERGDGTASTLDAANTDAANKYKILKSQELAIEEMGRQLLLAKLDEARDGPLLQQIDVASPAEKPVRPKALVIFGAGFIFSLGIAIFVGVLRGLKMAKLPQQAQPLMD